jgi:hypothetical protein
MVKSKADVEEKLAERVAVSGKWHKRGMESSEVNPNDAALKKLDLMKARFDKAMDSGRTAAGMKEAADAKRWEGRIDVAATRWEESSEFMRDRYMEGYDDRVACIEESKRKVASLPATTIEQRAEKSKQYQIAMSKCMEKKRGIGGR